jgi:hypothetical protein
MIGPTLVIKSKPQQTHKFSQIKTSVRAGPRTRRLGRDTRLFPPRFCWRTLFLPAPPLGRWLGRRQTQCKARLVLVCRGKNAIIAAGVIQSSPRRPSLSWFTSNTHPTQNTESHSKFVPRRVLFSLSIRSISISLLHLFSLVSYVLYSIIFPPSPLNSLAQFLKRLFCRKKGIMTTVTRGFSSTRTEIIIPPA